MLKQTFVVTLEISPLFYRYFPWVEAERMAGIICDGVEAKGIGFMGPTPFTIRVERTDKAASLSGQIREYSPEELPEGEEAVQEPVRTVKAVQVK